MQIAMISCGFIVWLYCRSLRLSIKTYPSRQVIGVTGSRVLVADHDDHPRQFRSAFSSGSNCDSSASRQFMSIKAAQQVSDESLRAAVCIVGAGAAGITLACEFDGNGFPSSCSKPAVSKTTRRIGTIYRGTWSRRIRHGPSFVASASAAPPTSGAGAACRWIRSTSSVATTSPTAAGQSRIRMWRGTIHAPWSISMQDMPTSRSSVLSPSRSDDRRLRWRGTGVA